MTITDKMALRAARSDAAFDGRQYDAMSRHDRERYLARSKAALTAALEEEARRVDGIDALTAQITREIARASQHSMQRGAALSSQSIRKMIHLFVARIRAEPVAEEPESPSAGIDASRIAGLVSSNAEATDVEHAVAAAIARHRMEAAAIERARCAQLVEDKSRPSVIRLAAGEMTAQEMRTAQALLGNIGAAIREGVR